LAESWVPVLTEPRLSARGWPQEDRAAKRTRGWRARGAREKRGKAFKERRKNRGGVRRDATRGRTDGRGPRPERIDWRDPPGARPVSLHPRRTSLLHAALCGCGGNSWLVVVGRATPCGHDIPLRNVASLLACLPAAARSQDLGLRRLPANAESASTTLI